MDLLLLWLLLSSSFTLLPVLCSFLIYAFFLIYNLSYSIIQSSFLFLLPLSCYICIFLFIPPILSTTSLSIREMHFCRKARWNKRHITEIKRHNIQNILWEMKPERTAHKDFQEKKQRAIEEKMTFEKEKSDYRRHRKERWTRTERERAAKHRRSDRMTKHRNEEGTTDEERATEETRG